MKQTHLLATVLSLILLSGNAFSNSAATSRTLELDGAHFEYIDAGSGEPVVFVHGAIADHRAWAEYVEPISESHRFVSHTRRYYGDKDWPENPVYDFEQHAEDLVEVIERLGVGPVHLVGWSSSGIILAYVAAEHPQLVKSMVVYEPVLSSELMSGYTHTDRFAASDEDWGARWSAVDEQLASGDMRHAVRKFAELVFEMAPGAFDSLPASQKNIFLTNARTIPLYFNRTHTEPTTCEYVGMINTPTLILNGIETGKWFSMQADRLQECMPNASMQLIPGVHHDGPIASPLSVTSAILNFVDTHR